MSVTEVDKIFDTLDVNKDGKLDFKEFTGLYENTTKQLNHLLSVRGIVVSVLGVLESGGFIYFSHLIKLSFNYLYFLGKKLFCLQHASYHMFE